MANNRNFTVKQGIEVGTNLVAGNTITSNAYISNKSDVLTFPTLALNFTKGVIDSRVKSIRLSNATYLAANGKIVEVNFNTPRIEWSTNGECIGLLSEESRTNTATYSDIEGVDGTQPLGMSAAGSWPDQGGTISSDVWIGPNGQSARHVRGTTGVTTGIIDNNVGVLGSFTGVTNAWYSGSLYVYIPANSNITTCVIAFESSTLTLNPNPIISANLQLVNTWQRLETTCLVTGGTGFASLVLRIDPIGAYMYSDCWQVEAGEYASSWIPTRGGSTTTRQGDLNYISPVTPYLNLDEFAISVEAVPRWTANSLMISTINSGGTSNASRGILSLDLTNASTSIGTTPFNGYAVQIYQYASTSSLNFQSRELIYISPSVSNSFNQRVVSIPGAGFNYSSNIPIKLSLKLTTTDTKLALNGIDSFSTQSGTAYSNAIVFDRLRIGMQNSAGTPPTQFGGYIKKISLFSKSLSNNELISLSET